MKQSENITMSVKLTEQIESELQLCLATLRVHIHWETAANLQFRKDPSDPVIRSYQADYREQLETALVAIADVISAIRHHRNQLALDLMDCIEEETDQLRCATES